MVMIFSCVGFTGGKEKGKEVKKELKDFLKYSRSVIKDMQNVHIRINEDNRKFAVIWALVAFLYGAFSFVMSFYVYRFTLCRSAYIFVMVVAALAFCCAQFPARKKPFMVYLAMILDYIAIFGVGIMIARFLLQNNISGTIMVFASALIAPILFISNTFLNIVIALLDIIAAAVIMRGLPEDLYSWCLTDVVIFSSMGVTIGHFINKARFERYIFAETAEKLAQMQTQYAYHDRMTALKNRRAYNEKLEQYEKEMPADCCAAIVDINGLKKINDTLGHFAGDELIKGLADCLRSSFEGLDTIYRLGGDEFCVFADGMGKEISSCLTRLKTVCADWKGKYVNGISVSCGYATADEFSDIDTLLKAADDRMYAEKNEFYKSKI